MKKITILAALLACIGINAQAQDTTRSEEHTSELQSLMATLFPYTTLFRSLTKNII